MKSHESVLKMVHFPLAKTWYCKLTKTRKFDVIIGAYVSTRSCFSTILKRQSNLSANKNSFIPRVP